MFEGYAEQHLTNDPVYATLKPGGHRHRALVGRAVDVDVSTVSFAMDPIPGRHMAVLGTTSVGADVLQAAVFSLAKQHEPGAAWFVLAGLAAHADATITETAAALAEAGHEHAVLGASDLNTLLSEGQEHNDPEHPLYLVVFGGDAISQVWNASAMVKFRNLLKAGPTKGVHMLVLWRGFRRFTDDSGGSSGREDVACLVVLNIPGNTIGSYIGDISSDYEPRSNRALVIDRHDNTKRLAVPFVRPGREADDEY